MTSSNKEKDQLVKELFQHMQEPQVSLDFTSRTMDRILSEVKEKQSSRLRKKLLVTSMGVSAVLLTILVVKFTITSHINWQLLHIVLQKAILPFNGILSTISASFPHMRNISMVAASGLVLLILDLFWRRHKLER